MLEKIGNRFIAITILCAVLLCTGCSSSTALKHAPAPDLSFWKPNLLYLNSSKYDRLYIEIDAVEGCQPRAESIEALRAFLEKYTNKPGGIEIVRDSQIKTADARAGKPELLALNHMAGPPTDRTNDKTAYLYILFYDSSRLTGNNYDGTINPYVRILPYPSAIYIDMKYVRKEYMGALKEHEQELLLHEVGHVLGLTWSTSKNGDDHCRKKSCLMNERYEVDMFKVLTGQKIKKKHFCKSCLKQLKNAGNDEKNDNNNSDSNLKFIGPLMVRSEKNYHVIALPSFVKLHFGSIDSIVWQDVLEEARIEAPIRAGKPDTVAVVMDTDHVDGMEDMTSVHKMIATVENDPYKTVRLGVNMIKKGLWRQYGLEYLAARRRQLAQVNHKELAYNSPK